MVAGAGIAILSILVGACVVVIARDGFPRIVLPRLRQPGPRVEPRVEEPEADEPDLGWQHPHAPPPPPRRKQETYTQFDVDHAVAQSYEDIQRQLNEGGLEVPDWARA